MAKDMISKFFNIQKNSYSIFFLFKESKFFQHPKIKQHSIFDTNYFQTLMYAINL